MPNELFYLNSLDRSRVPFMIFFFFRQFEFFCANFFELWPYLGHSITTYSKHFCSLVNLGLHYLHMFLLWDLRHKWVKELFFFFALNCTLYALIKLVVSTQCKFWYKIQVWIQDNSIRSSKFLRDSNLSTYLSY